MAETTDEPTTTSSLTRSDLVVHLETATVALYYHPRKKYVHHEIRSFVHGKPLRELLEMGLALFKAHGACKWLSDDRGNGPVTAADADWSTNDWGPRMIAAGWKYWAVVLPLKVLGQMNMRRWIETYAASGVTAKAFTEPGPAREWLEQQ